MWNDAMIIIEMNKGNEWEEEEEIVNRKLT